MATLVHNAEEIAPRELKPALYELEGISRESVEAHYKLYEGYVGKRNEILAALEGVQHRMQPVLLKLQDYDLFFHHNLNASQ